MRGRTCWAGAAVNTAGCRQEEETSDLQGVEEVMKFAR